MTPPLQGAREGSDAVTSSGLPFTRKKMVDWLHPTQLAITAVKAALSGVFGAYTDKRELQAALHPWTGSQIRYDADYSSYTGKDFWFDFVADVGDGFDSTYSIAWLLARSEVILPGEERHPLPQGRFLVLGGDQVYPTASRLEYQNRFRGPYESAFPGEPDPHTDPSLFALPGNHDWYDGLTSFIRLFCQERGIGRWATHQTMSYFALKLPSRWWLWGVDIQLESDIDRPQMQFFDAVAKQMLVESPAGEAPRLILCTGQPSWTECGPEPPDGRGIRHPEPDLFDNEAFFEDRIIRRNGIRLAVTLSGDLHHYMRYTEAQEPTGAAAPEQATQRITSGGGGAYLYPTHHMPKVIELPEGISKVRYQRQVMFPDEAESRRLAHGVGWLPFRNRWFTFFLGMVYLIYAWTLQSASKAHPICPHAGPGTDSLMECIQSLGVRSLGEVLLAFGKVLQHSPSNVVFGAFVIVGLYLFRASEDHSWTRWFGALHGVAHLGLCALLIWGISILDLRVRHMEVDSLWQALCFGGLMLLGGGIAGAWLFAGYLWAASKDHACHMNDVFSSQHLAGYKNFLRLRISPDGLLTIHAIGVPQVPTGDAWVERVSPDPGESQFAPPENTIAVRRIDGPILCR
jgi:hypothetical protein